MVKKKVKQETIREWQEKKRKNRWVVAGVFLVMTLVTVGFWWQGKLKEGVKDVWQPKPMVWEREEVKNQSASRRTDIKDEVIIDTSEVEGQIRGMVEGLRGRYVVYSKNLECSTSTSLSVKMQNSECKSRGNWEFEVGPEGDFSAKQNFMNEPMQAASLIKVPVIVAVYRMAERGEVDLEDVYKLREADRVGGSGSLVGKPVGYEVTWRKLLWHMGNESDNTAFQAMVNLVGEERLAGEFTKMGLWQVSIKDNQVTPKEIVDLFEGLYAYRWVNKDDSEQILDSMIKTWYEDRIPAGVPDDIKVAHKVGTEVGVVGDAGIVYAPQPYLLVVMTENVNEIEAKEAVPEISRTVWKWQSEIKD